MTTVSHRYNGILDSNNLVNQEALDIIQGTISNSPLADRITYDYFYNFPQMEPEDVADYEFTLEKPYHLKAFTCEGYDEIFFIFNNSPLVFEEEDNEWSQLVTEILHNLDSFSQKHYGTPMHI